MKLAAADLLDRPLLGEDVIHIARATDALLGIFDDAPEADFLFTRGNYAIGGDWNALVTKAQNHGNYLAITGRVYGAPKSTRYGNIFADIVPQRIVNHIESWFVNSAIPGQITREIPTEYFFVNRNQVPMFLQAAELTDDIEAMIDMIFGFANVTGQRFLYTPKLVGCEYAEIPDVVLG